MFVSQRIPKVPSDAKEDHLAREMAAFERIGRGDRHGLLPYQTTVQNFAMQPVQPTNLAVPGLTVEQALTLTPNPNASPGDPVAGWANIVLGFPTPFVVPGAPQTQIQQAVSLKPTTVIIWLGNNDALLPVLFGGQPRSPYAAESLASRSMDRRSKAI